MGRSAPKVRPLAAADAAGAAALLRELEPYFVVDERLVLHWLRASPERAEMRMWVAEEGGTVAGFAFAELKWTRAEPGSGEIWVGVLPPWRGRGTGARLYDLAEEHLAAHRVRRIESWVGPDPAGARFAERRGFETARHERMSQLDVRAADVSDLPALEAEKRAEGFSLAPLAAVLDRKGELHRLWLEAAADTPREDALGDVPLEDWERGTLGDPLLDPEGSTVVLHGERPVSFAWVQVDRAGGRGFHELTGTLRAYRGRGLARLAKLAVVRWSAANGVHMLTTGNDAENAAMLAINDRLGYEPTMVVREVVKRL